MIIKVIGLPAPQGSKRGFVNRRTGRVAMVESSAKVKPWREAVKCAAYGKRGAHQQGPVVVEIVFTMPRPKSAPKSRLYPDRKPDIDKLCRSTLDALVEAGAIEDDARVVSLSARKVFPKCGEDSLPVPGAVIYIGSRA